MQLNGQIVQLVWTKAIIVPGYNPAIVRKDICGAWIYRQEYGNRRSSYGWEIDHIIPQSRGGSDLITNLRPLHWENNIARQDNLALFCRVKASV